MSRTDGMRVLLGLALAAALAAGGIRKMPSSAVSAAARPSQPRETLRVGLWTLWRDREVELAPASTGGKVVLHTCAECTVLSLARPSRIRATGNAVTLRAAGRTGSTERISINGTATLTAHGETLALHNPVTITAHNGILTMVVTMPVESYVERVVASESGAADSSESLKALAIVVRTFAQHEAHGHADYDLCDSTHCQLLHWGGNGKREPAAHAATLATAGETLWFHGQRALAYFHKDCGGHTAAVEEIWPRAHSLSYLTSLPDRYCTANGSGEWASEATHAELTSALAAHGLARPGWQSLTITQRGRSGRAVKLRLDGAEISAEDFRIAVGESLGWNRVPSTWFEVAQRGDRFEFHGRGWGHGVGLCQKGSAAMAAQGRSAREILAQYFSGAVGADEQSGRQWQSYTAEGFVLETLDPADTTFVTELKQARAEASQRSGLNAAAPFTVRTFVSTEEFRSATLAPGWVAAFTEGDWIGTQPLRTLAARKLLISTLRHEFLHALVEHETGPSAPLWLREGLVEAWSDGYAEGPMPVTRFAPVISPGTVNAALAQAGSESESETAHRAAAWYAAQLLSHYGRAQVLAWLRSGVPAGVLSALDQR